MALNKKKQKEIEQAVKEAEKNNHGEIVPVYLSSSDLYPAAHFRLSLLFAAVVPFVTYFLPLTSFIEITPLWYVTLPFPAAIVGYLLAFIPFLKRALCTKAEFKEEVHQKAVEIFFEQELHATENRAVIMLLVSRLERRFEVLADVGINQKVEPQTWEKMVSDFYHRQQDFPKKERPKRVVESLIKVIKECGTLLDRHFPLSEGKTSSEEKSHPESSEQISNSPITD